MDRLLISFGRLLFTPMVQVTVLESIFCLRSILSFVMVAFQSQWNAGILQSVPLRTTIRIFTVFSISCLPRVGIRALGYSTLLPSYLWKGVCSFPRVF